MCIKLMPAMASDRDFLLTLRKLTMTEHLEKVGLYLSDDEHQYILNDGYKYSHIIVESSKKIGLIRYRESARKIEIMQLQIHPAHQGRGLGSDVVECMLGLSRTKLKAIELSVLKGNPARKLYERLGFYIVGEDDYEFQMVFNHNQFTETNKPFNKT